MLLFNLMLFLNLSTYFFIFTFLLTPIHPSSSSLVSNRSSVVPILFCCCFLICAALSLCGFPRLPLFCHEYLSNCYNWALIKLKAYFLRKSLEHLTLAAFTQTHVHPPTVPLNYGVHPQQQAISGNTLL